MQTLVAAEVLWHKKSDLLENEALLAEMGNILP
jgi:hypothetical protein